MIVVMLMVMLMMIVVMILITGRQQPVLMAEILSLM